MTEIPQHLLDRSKARRALLTGGGGDDAAPDAGSGDGGGGAVVAAAAATPAPAKAAPVEKIVEPPKPVPHYIKAAEARQRIPVWALPVVVALPLWALVYAGTLKPPEQIHPALEEGAEIYNGAAGCAGCHGPEGGGGVGYAFNGGEIQKTFPNRYEQHLFIAVGSNGTEGPYGNPDREGGQRVPGARGVMPAFADDTGTKLTALELDLVVAHERYTLGGEEPDLDYLDALEERVLEDEEEEINIEDLQAQATAASEAVDGVPYPTDEELFEVEFGVGEEAAGE